MRAQLLEVTPNYTKKFPSGKSIKGLRIVYQAEPYKGNVKAPTERVLFDNDPAALAFMMLEPGTWVELSFNNDKYKSILSVVAVDGPNPPSASEATPASAHTCSGMCRSDEPSLLRRSSLNHAVNLAAACIGTPDSEADVLETVFTFVRAFEDYLTNGLPSDEEETNPYINPESP